MMRHRMAGQMSDAQLMDLLMADKYGSPQRGYMLDEDDVIAMGMTPRRNAEALDELAQALQEGQGSLTASQSGGGGFAFLAEMMFNPVLAERVNQALLEKERMG